jgi:DNA-binding transcriptional LysR family regulator
MTLSSDFANVNLRHLRAIHAIWREGSFARAAERLGVVPSALSETVRQVEEIAGAPLFDRRTRPPSPTAIGLDFLRETRPVLEQLDAALDHARDRARAQSGALRIGASPSAIGDMVAPALTAFRRDHPDVPVTLHDDVAETLADMVSDGRLDLAVAGRARTSAELIQTPVGGDRFGLACAADHPLARRGGSATLDEIDPATIIHLGAQTGSALLLAGTPGLPREMTSGPLRTHSTVAQLCLVRAGVGVALLPEKAVGLFNDPQIRFVGIADLALERRLYLLRPARRTPPWTAGAFLRALAAHLGLPGLNDPA